MRHSDIVEILAAHADALNTGRHIAPAYISPYSAEAAELASLLALAQQIKEALAPVVLSPAFRHDLHRQLLAGESERSLPAGHPRGRKLWWGAATVGSLVSVGLIYYWRRQREDGLVELPAT
jgi:hypothetical protein